MRGLWFACLVLAATVVPAQAGSRFNVPEDEPPYGATTLEVALARANGCSGPQTELNLCAWSFYRESQARLYEAVSEHTAEIRRRGQRLAPFEREQRNWLATRDAQCDSQGADVS